MIIRLPALATKGRLPPQRLLLSRFGNLDTTQRVSGGGDFGAMTCTAAGTQTNHGALAQTFGAMTGAAIGDIVDGSTYGFFDQTFGAMTSTAAGTNTDNGALAQTFGAMTSTAAGTNTVNGDVTQTFGAMSLVATGGRLDITPSMLTVSGSTTDATSYATASVSPSANALVLLWVASQHASSLNTVSSVTGNALTWVQVDTQASTSNTTRRLSLYRALGASPSAGAITIDFGANTQTACTWGVVQFTNVNTSGTNGSGAVVQSAKNVDGTNSATTITNTLSAFENAKNVHASGVSTGAATASTADSNFTTFGHNEVATNPITGEYEYCINRVACSPTFPASRVEIIGVEVKAG